MACKMRFFLSPIRLSLRSTRFSSSSANANVQQSSGVDKTALMQLRRKTGFSFVNCKEALLKFGSDIEAAEKWLQELAIKQGWEKATKLVNRHAAQGLIGVFASQNVGAIVEVNCETDFVGRNEKFRDLVVAAATSCFNVAKKRLPVSSDSDKWELQGADLAALCTADGTPLTDMVAFTTGQVAEKLQLGRAICMSVRDGGHVFGYSHPRSPAAADGVTMGQYGALVAFERNLTQQTSSFPNIKLGEQLCQHIVGMNPKSLGTVMSADEKEKLKTTLREAEEKRRLAEEKASPLVEVIGGEPISLDESHKEDHIGATVLNDETQLLRQDFLLHPDISVGEYLRLHDAAVLDFVRFECGEGK